MRGERTRSSARPSAASASTSDVPPPSAPAPGSHPRLRLAVAMLTIAALLAPFGSTGCSWTRHPTAKAAAVVRGLGQVPAAPAGRSWAPRPTSIAGLRTGARASSAGYALSTAHGAVTFLPGINLGGTTPGREPGELGITAGDYRAWFSAMRHLGVRVIRIYTIHPPAFYQELRRYNRQHPDDPLYLLQGVYLPDVSYQRHGDLYDEALTTAFTQELDDAVAAVYGELDRAQRPGHAAGRWRADVSPWLAGWILGVEFDPAAIAASDARNAGRPAVAGRYFGADPTASPTERWLAARMDELATAQARRGDSSPVAFVNWPTTDPLSHPDEPMPQEDLVGVDANRIRVTDAWPGGQFASYHAYPYYPDFLRHQPDLARFTYQGRTDPYAGYLDSLRRHHAAAGIPVMVTELGVPAAAGSAHGGPLGRDQGAHSEQEAMRVDAEVLRLVRDLGLAGGLLFEWADEWFKPTWNTANHQIPADRRRLWHDACTNEQWFGLVATDPAGAGNPGTQRLRGRGDGPVAEATARVDEGYLYLDLRLRDVPAGTVAVGLDAVPQVTGVPRPGSGDERADLVLELDPATRTGQEWVRGEVDPLALDTIAGPAQQPAPGDGWRPLRLLTNHPLVVPSTGQALPAEFQEIGALRWGTWDPSQPAYDSRAVWQVTGTRLRIRLPWALAGQADPSSHQALWPAAPSGAVSTPGVGVSLTVAGSTLQLGTVTWRGWEHASYTYRLKAGASAVRDAFAAM